MRTVTIVSAGLSTPSSSLSLAQEIAAEVRKEVAASGQTLTVQVIELRNLAVDLAHSVTENATSLELQQAIDSVRSADALIAVTPVFKASYSGLFKMFFDVLQPQDIHEMPVIIAANAGSQRHALVLEYAVRPLFTYLKAATVPTAILATPHDRLPENSDAFCQRIHRAAHELALLLTP
ncbi:CE1759 family FMN reductase [Corynebacterium silvaticum]|uniref:NAD(P)H-dependent oxidoreductase n=1 Tax=Corynebacterium silvaticum TaxID=2320431 RepID=A0A7Y4LG76_9CORY|nr:CE1759 family FMN reductase [Corynebacterium silvaticum]ARU46253.1 NAD(P)H-dependent oxidoreductase [Corynebacterium silvaticum]MBH5299375.1 NAD(P)H-dependent oxidoreductase [Corynebacterium silvaticum]NOM64305.1 FMN reductase [Corynebacterium silvaticum]NON69514.1 FMN reductase [Corynebacterium silvaticum]TFA94138.1 FMN reductase [Corynebacterium silvaticum]